MSHFSPAADRNKTPIFAALNTKMAQGISVLEIGAGTGQHALYFTEQRPDLSWQPTEHENNLETLSACLSHSSLNPLCITISKDVSYSEAVDWLYTANTVHIMSWQEVEWLFAFVNQVLKKDGYFSIYGPFIENGAHTSDSNAAFDRSLKQRNADMGLRDIVNLNELAKANTLKLVGQTPMPANNQLLLFRRL